MDYLSDVSLKDWEKASANISDESYAYYCSTYSDPTIATCFGIYYADYWLGFECKLVYYSCILIN